MADKGLPVPEDTGLIRGTYGNEAANALRLLKEEKQAQEKKAEDAKE